MKKKTKAVIPGSYDPITLGHLDIIKRSSEIFDEVCVLICVNTAKSALLDPYDRKAVADDAISGIDNAYTDVCRGLFADYVHENGFNVVVKGIRNNADFEYENGLFHINSAISGEKYGEFCETVYMPSRPEHAVFSSSLVRELIKFNSDFSFLVHDSKLIKSFLK